LLFLFLRFFHFSFQSSLQIGYFILFLFDVSYSAQSRLIERDRLRVWLKMISRETAALRIGRCWCGLTNEYRTTGLADRQAGFLIAIFRNGDSATTRSIARWRKRDADLLSLKLHEASDNYRKIPLWIPGTEIDPHSSAYMQRNAWDALEICFDPIFIGCRRDELSSCLSSPQLNYPQWNPWTL